ncbi:TonB-dependent receptor domain-containing protein [Flavobacterium myungsuense]|uniref:TonB-dependent receptor domain-containing protein n=1 Tax=Flavobacterium myungsuense TaxID=651823 RepID=A0ABW3J5F9_9FLAO
MKNPNYLFLAFLFLFSISLFAQNSDKLKTINIKGIVIEKVSKQPLEYATITFLNTSNLKTIAGGITNNKGEFTIATVPGVYTIKIEFISFRPTEIINKKLSENTNLGIIVLEEDATQLNQVEIRAEKSTVEIKLDKKVYNVGQDLMVKGGTVSDVLDNIPSVTVDVEGNVSLRGNNNVRILIDGRPSVAINIAEALRLIPADAIDKVEVITNPSARYDAEGGGGILNIILKKGKNNGVNGILILSAGTPENTGASGNINVRSEFSNIFATLGYNKRNNPGNTEVNQENFNPDGSFKSYVEERRTNNRKSEGFNGIMGIELYLNKSTTWINTLTLRNNNGDNPENIFFSITNADNSFIKTSRFNDLFRSSQDVEYATNFIKTFKKEGAKLTIDASFSQNRDKNNSNIFGNQIVPIFNFISSERTTNLQSQNRNLIQSDYVLPIGKNSQFEAGFRGNYLTLNTDFKVEEDVLGNNNFTINSNFTNIFEYVENVSALYSQFGSKINKFSYLFGLRFENSNIEVNQITLQDFNAKKYTNFFPSAFFTYEIKEGSSVSINYSKRITRPRDLFINPFSQYSSNINLFQGNPDLNPSLSDAFDLGYLKKWGKTTLSTSLYINRTSDAFQIVRKERGDLINGIPVIINTPFNLATDDKIGFEFTLNYSPYKWWRLNTNFNFFSNKTDGSYTYIKASNEIETINFNNSSSTWFARITSKVTLPYKIDFQTNGTYNAPQKVAQGTNKGVASMNLAFSKDILKDKGTLSFTVNDVFNSRKRINALRLPNVNSDMEMQWRERQLTLSFTYRFNKQKGDKEKSQKRENDSGGEDFQG